MVRHRKRRIGKIHIGLRTVKTAVAIIVAMVVVDLYGATSDKLIFAMLGAMAVIQPTFKESVESCVSQIVGVILGALFSLILDALPIGPMVSIGIGVIGIIAVYNALRLKISPSLPCFILVMICLSDTMEPISYALGRIWDTAIGLGVGMVINMLILPYNNSLQIQNTIKSLDKDLLRMLEELFDGDTILPDPEEMGAGCLPLSGSWTYLLIKGCCSICAGSVRSWNATVCANGRLRPWWLRWRSSAAWAGRGGSTRRTGGGWRLTAQRFWICGPWIPLWSRMW